MSAQNRPPVTLLAGFLGAGKTTLLNRILSEDHGRRYAVVVNEFGEIGIDGDLIAGGDEEVLEMSNGCVCCTARGDLLVAFRNLLDRGDRFDAVVLEASGLADPGAVAQAFFLDDELRGLARLDSVTTVVDAKHVALSLAENREAAAQIAIADLIILNKIDLVSAPDLGAIEARLRALNPLAPIQRAERARVPLEAVIGRGGFDLERIAGLGEPGHVHDADCADDTHHDSAIRAVSLVLTEPLDGDRVGEWLNDLVTARGPDILRAKGILDIAGEDRRLVFHAVHSVLEGDLQRPWRAGETRSSRMVFIGRGLDEAALRSGLEACATPRRRPAG